MKKTSYGLSLIELLLTLSIGLMIILGAEKYFSSVMNNQKIAKSMEDIRAIRAAASEWILAQPDYAGGSANCTSTPNNCISMSVLYSAGLLPSSLGNGLGKSAWHTNYTVSPAVNTTQLKIEIANVPMAMCSSLTRAMSNQALSASCTNLSPPYNFTIIFG